MTEDILQEIFLKALIALKDSHTNMRAWLYTVARNLCLNYLQKERRTEALDGEDARAAAFREAADYVEQNGMTVYGFASVMDKETVLRLAELPEVYVVYTEKY